jgi:NAD-dependent deacetylase
MSGTELPHVTDFQRVVFFTGAGMSAASGVPTYRGKGGIWKEYDYTSYACQDAFDRDPAAVWEFHNYRRHLVAACAPNEGHQLIARCEAALPDVTVVTQNIDGLHQLAGSDRVLELHGTLWGVRCDETGARRLSRDVPFAACRSDGLWWRPDIVWFGDSLRDDVVDAAMTSISSSDLFVSIGTSAVVFPAARMPFYARQAGATLVEINPEETPVSHLYDHCAREPATTALARMCVGVD